MPRITMTSRERMLAALNFRPVDVVPLQLHASPAGIHEHGQKLVDLIKACGHDFGPLDDLALPVIPAADFDADGRYHKISADDWGTTWEFRIYGIWGHRTQFPLDDWANLDSYNFPPNPRLAGAELEKRKQAAARHRQKYFHCGGGASIFETAQNLRNFEDTLIDILTNAPEMNRLLDRIVDYYAVTYANALAVDTDAVKCGDDFGMQQTMIFPHEVWKRAFKPRYQRLFAPVRAANKKILFHSCGAVGPLLQDFRDVGINALWPQLPIFNHRELAHQCRDIGLALQLHPDRGELMQHAQPQQVRDYLLQLVDEFDILNGGAWLYLEVDPGFPWENVEIMYRTAMELRSQ